MANLKDKQEQSDVEIPAPKMKRKEYEKQDAAAARRARHHAGAVIAWRPRCARSWRRRAARCCAVLQVKMARGG